VTEPKALQLAYSYLNKRDRTEAEMRTYLSRRDLSDAEADAAVSELVELGYVDDARYARLFAEDKRALEQWGSDRIRRSLAERGVDRELIEAALAEVDPDTDELSRAVALLRQRFPQTPADRRERDRAIGVLVRKGFDAEVALDALTALAHDDDG
jgi:regulatory protein